MNGTWYCWGNPAAVKPKICKFCGKEIRDETYMKRVTYAARVKDSDKIEYAHSACLNAQPNREASHD